MLTNSHHILTYRKAADYKGLRRLVRKVSR